MACGACGGTTAKPRTCTVTLEDGTAHTFLTLTEARIFATANGGGHIDCTG